jgi:hypothetical protein
MRALPAVSKRLGEANLLWEFLAGKRKSVKLEREGNEAVLGAFWGLVAEKMKGGGKSSHARRSLHTRDKRRMGSERSPASAAAIAPPGLPPIARKTERQQPRLPKMTRVIIP